MITRSHLKSALIVLALALVSPGTALAAAPGATTGDATAVSSTSATVTGSVNPNKESTTYHFEYGTTTAYGTVTPNQGPVGGNAGKSASADLAQLTPSTTYHYRLVATNPSGTTNGADKTFTTLAAGQAPPGGNAVTIAATPASVAFGRATTISGQVTGSGNGGVQVTLESQPLGTTGGKFTTVTSTTTDASGNYTFTVTPTENTQYQVSAKTSPPATSPLAQVKVRFAVTLRLSDATPRRGSRVRFSGVVRPARAGGFALIQRRTRTGTFRTVAKALLRPSTAGQSTYSTRLRVRSSGVYRVRVPGDSSHAAGTSPRRRIRVH
jgi:hypothetical protein